LEKLVINYHSTSPLINGPRFSKRRQNGPAGVEKEEKDINEPDRTYKTLRKLPMGLHQMSSVASIFSSDGPNTRFL
jgi:hypothetical protein